MPRLAKYRLAAVTAVVLGVGMAVTAASPATAAPGGTIAQLQAQIDALQQQLDQQASALATKQNIITGTCPQGQNLSQVNTDGSIVCAQDAVQFTVGFNSLHLNPFESGSIVADCPTGMTAVGGGFVQSNVNVFRSQSVTTGWEVSGVTNLLGGDFEARAVCISTAP